MARQCTQPKRLRNSAWFKEKMLLIQAQGSGRVLDEEQLAFLADPGIAEGQVTQTTIPQNTAFQNDDLDAYDSDCDDIYLAKAVLMANLSSYDSDVLSEKAQRIKPTLYDGIVISKKHDVTSVVDEEETLILEEESRSKMLAKQNDTISKEKKIDISPFNFSELNKLSADFGKRFVPQMQLSAEQDFWLRLSNPKSEQLDVIQTPVEIEVPKELPKCSVDKKYFDIQKKELSLDNDRLLDHIICQDVMNIMMHDNFVPVNVLSANHKCLVDGNLESERQENDHLFELLLSQDIVHICVNSLATLTNYAKMKQDYIDEYSENLVLKAELAKKGTNAKLDAKDVSIANLKTHIESLKGKNVVERDVTPNKAKVIAPGMFKLDLEPLSLKVLKNRDAHMDYIKHTQKNVNILQELVKHAKALKPLNSDLDSA
ncbi:hypothetical protein Tco_1249429, partial [Tanacetum coccineum]